SRARADVGGRAAVDRRAAAVPVGVPRMNPGRAMLRPGPFPERAADAQTALDRWLHACWQRRPPSRGAADRLAAGLTAQRCRWQQRSDAELRVALRTTAAPAYGHGGVDDLALAVALASLAAERSLGCRPHPPQQH